MSYRITCPYCFETMDDTEVHFRSERVNKGDSGILPERYDDDLRRFMAQYDGADKEDILRRYYDWQFFAETDDEQYRQFWSRFNERHSFDPTESDPADKLLGVIAYRRRVIDPLNVNHQRYLKKQPNNSYFIYDDQGMVKQIELLTGEKCDRRVCCHCHNPLPKDYGKNKQCFASVIGITGAGKTVYLSQILYKMKTYASRVGLSATVNTTSTKDFLTNNRIVEEKPLPASTPAGRLQQPLFYEMIRDAGDNRKVTETFVLYDVAGEVFTKPTLIQSFAPFIEHSNGLILLIDPMQFEVISGASRDAEQLDDPTTALDAIHSIVSHNTAEKSRIPLAVCIAQVDRPEVQAVIDEDLKGRLLQDVQGIKRSGSKLFAPIFNAHDHNPIAKDIDEWISNNAVELAQQLETNYADYSYFAFTALGCSVVPSEEYGGVMVPAGPILPKRIEEPIQWLFYRLGYIAANERLYNPAGDLIVCEECGSEDTVELKGDDAIISEGWGPFRRTRQVNRKCNKCGHRWLYVPKTTF